MKFSSLFFFVTVTTILIVLVTNSGVTHAQSFFQFSDAHVDPEYRIGGLVTVFYLSMIAIGSDIRFFFFLEFDSLSCDALKMNSIMIE